MIRNKKIVLTHTIAARCLELLGVALLVAVFALVLSLYKSAPDTVPTGYALTGPAREWGVRQAALITPIFTVYVYLVLTGIDIMARRIARRNDPGGATAVALRTLLYIKLVCLVYAIVRTHSVMLARDMPAWAGCVLPVGIALALVSGIVAFKHRAASPAV